MWGCVYNRIQKPILSWLLEHSIIVFIFKKVFEKSEVKRFYRAPEQWVHFTWIKQNNKCFLIQLKMATTNYLELYCSHNNNIFTTQNFKENFKLKQLCKYRLLKFELLIYKTIWKTLLTVNKILKSVFKSENIKHYLSSVSIV